MARKRGDILIVDDDPGMSRLLSICLESEGYKVRTADDGETAMAEALKARPDLVISDLRMEHGTTHRRSGAWRRIGNQYPQQELH